MYEWAVNRVKEERAIRNLKKAHLIKAPTELDYKPSEEEVRAEYIKYGGFVRYDVNTVIGAVDPEVQMERVREADEEKPKPKPRVKK